MDNPENNQHPTNLGRGREGGQELVPSTLCTTEKMLTIIIVNDPLVSPALCVIVVNILKS